MNTVPLDYQNLIREYHARKFTRNDIKSFVYKVFAMYERASCENVYVGEEAFHDLVAQNIYVDFPDYQIRSREEFKEWHRWIHNLLISDDHDIGQIDVTFLDDGKYQVEFVVRWRGAFKDGKFTDINVKQIWTMREQPEFEFPVIEKYLAKVECNED
ncbi:hypothetical protein ACSKZ4_004515 [Vibrio alginolyticus]